MSHRIRRSALAVAATATLIGAGVVFPPAAAEPQVTLDDSVLHGLAHATDLGPTNPTRVIGIGVQLARPDPSGEAALVHDLYDPSSPSYLAFPTPDEFNARFGVPESTTSALIAWLQSGGLDVQTIAGTTDYVTASGTASQLERLLSLPIHDYLFRGARFYAGTQAPSVPARLGVDGITGLNDLEGPRLLDHSTGKPGSRPALVGPSTNMGLTTPYDLWSIYRQPSNNKGDGQKLAIFGWGTTNNTLPDLRQFEREYHFPAMPYSISYFGPEKKITDNGGEGEWNIDTQASSGMAPNASAMKLYFGKAGTDPDLIAAYNAWAGDRSGPLQGSSSFSGCEQAPGTNAAGGGPGNPGGVVTVANAMQRQYELALTKAVALGKTMFASTGDTGSGCPAIALELNGVTIVPTPQQGYPAISPHAVGVGGTVLYWDGGGSSPPSGATATRSLEYSWTHTGGGTSLFLAAPAYQQGVVGVVGRCVTKPDGTPYGMLAPLCRGNPDVAAQSGDITGNGYTITSSGTNDTAGGGTSLSSPLWLGMWTRIQAASPRLKGNGFANPALYRIGKDATKDARDFFDVGNPTNTATTVSCNGLNCSHIGWDYTSGLGTPNVTNLMRDIDGRTAPRVTPRVNPVPPPPPPDRNYHGGTTCPGPQIVADDPAGSTDGNNTPGGSGMTAPNYDLVNARFSTPDPKTLRVTIAVKDLEGSPDGTADANLGDVWISALWNMAHTERNLGAAVSYGSSSLTDSSKSWVANEWAGGTVTAAGQTMDVVSNTATTLTLFSAWARRPAAASAYAVTASTPYFAAANSTGPGPVATWSFVYGQYDGNMFDNQNTAKSSSHATNGVYAGGAAGTVVIDVPLDASIGSPVRGSVLGNVRAESHGGPVGDVVYWTAPVDRAPDLGHGAPYNVGQVC